MGDECDTVDSYLSTNFGVKFAGQFLRKHFTDDVQMDTITMDAHVMAIHVALPDCVTKRPSVLTIS